MLAPGAPHVRSPESNEAQLAGGRGVPLPSPPGARGMARTGRVALSGNGRVLSLVNGSSGSSPSLVTPPPLHLTLRSGPGLAPNRNKLRKDFWLPGGGGCCFQD